MKRDFALIKPNAETGEHEVQAITLFGNPTEADMAARAIYGATAYAKESSQWNIQLPAIVKEGSFYNCKMKEMRVEDGKLSFVRVGETPAEYIPTPAEQIAELKKRNEELEEVLDQLVLKSLGGK
jgi:hypothetical protein|nr:MAG TPA: hypothetical protein [Caudoviricetes sp.]